MANTSDRSSPDELGGLFAGVARGCICGLIVVIALTLILTAVSLSMEDPDRLLRAFALTALFVGAAVSGFASAKFARENGLLAGLLGGVLYVLIVWLISVFFRGSADEESVMPPLWMALGYGICLAASLFGGLLGRGRRMKVGEGRKNPAAMARRQLGRSHR
ncbi:MAG: TIGR04086 family membrane protein [Clostridia bacterium]|nr:TIGR04086 family membrane protein [Clostridia bacterium]